MKKTIRHNRLQPSSAVTAAYLTPSFLMYAFFFILPILIVVLMSFFKFSSIKSFKFVGLTNYQMLFKDKSILVALKNNIFLVVVCLIGQLGLGFLLACMLSSRKAKFSNLTRTVIYFPVTLSAVVIGYIWQFVYDYKYGLITYIMNAMGMADKVTPLLSQVDYVMWYVCIPIVWQYVGFQLVIMLSAMTTIDKEILEVAELDGCNAVQEAWYITLPLIRPTLVICVFLCISANMKIFDHVMIMTNGGPGTASSVLALLAYSTSFEQFNMGYGSAISVFILVVTALLFLLSRLPGILFNRGGVR